MTRREEGVDGTLYEDGRARARWNQTDHPPSPLGFGLAEKCFGPAAEMAARARDAVPVVPATYPLWQQLRDTWKGGSVLPKVSSARKDFPLWSGFDAYFPAAIVAVAGWSKTANQKHNPGQPLQHARGKSADHQDCQRRHAIDSADPSCDKLEELTCKAWRALAELQEYAETLGAPPAPAATFPETTTAHNSAAAHAPEYQRGAGRG